MVLDGMLSLSRHDDDVLDPGHNALFHDVLNLRFVHDRQHFLGLGFRGGQETRAQSRGGQDRLAYSASCGALWLRCVSHRFPRWNYFFVAGFFSFDSLGVLSFVAESFSLLAVVSFVSVAGLFPFFPSVGLALLSPYFVTYQPAPLN